MNALRLTLIRNASGQRDFAFGRTMSGCSRGFLARSLYIPREDPGSEASALEGADAAGASRFNKFPPFFNIAQSEVLWRGEPGV